MGTGEFRQDIGDGANNKHGDKHRLENFDFDFSFFTPSLAKLCELVMSGD